MPHLLRLSLKHGPPDDGAPYPFSVPQIRSLPVLDVNVPVAFFVGENGSGKSTLLEGIAAAAELRVTLETNASGNRCCNKKARRMVLGGRPFLSILMADQKTSRRERA